jgi:hypothetical protein
MLQGSGATSLRGLDATTACRCAQAAGTNVPAAAVWGNVEGRPPKTIDVPGEGGSTYRYGLADWEQEGIEANYSFLYGV